MDVGYLEGIEFEEDLDNWFEKVECEIEDVCMMDQLLYGYYYEKDCDNENWVKAFYTVGDWLELWDAYVEGLDDSKDNVWNLKEAMNSWEDVEYAMHALECIKKEDSELFYKLFTSNFVSCFLYEIVKRSMLIPLNERKVKALAKWVQKHKGKEFYVDDFWNVAEKNLLSENLHYSCILCDTAIEYSRLWRICCQKPIYLSWKNQKHRVLYDAVRGYGMVAFGAMLEDFLNFCDGVVNNERLKDPMLLERIIKEENTELLYRALKKNVVTKKLAKEGIEKVLEMQKNHLIPMIMLKANGEWE